MGLQTYVEGDVLYGRDDDIRNLSQYVLTDSETVLYGKSGIGKSSVLNAGVLPRARMNGITPVVIRLAHGLDAEPYTIQLTNKIVSAGVKCGFANEGKQLTLWEMFHHEKLENAEGEPAKLLIVFDQFEEIFTLQQNAQLKHGFFQQLADIINDVMPTSLDLGAANSKDNDVIEANDSVDVLLDDMDFDMPDSANKYYYDNEIHLVFTLREDFLSEFEYYTASIPSLKQHRYGLRPINEEQAAEIIQKPRKELVAVDVAKLIIEKVTKRTDFKLDGTPEIEVDAAVLSLYLSKLYDKSDKLCITSELVEREAGNIIKEFYEECIAGIPQNVVDKLESILVNKEGHRENKSLNVLSEEVGIKGCVEDLIRKKLLRTFKYAGEEKVELIHDVLCDVVKSRKEDKEKRKKEEEERKALARQSRNNKIKFYISIFLLCIAGVTIFKLLLSNWKLQNEEGLGQHQEFAIKISEDSLVVADNEFWNARLLVVALGDTINDTIYNIEINKAFRDSTFRVEVVDSVKFFHIALDFELSRNKKYYKRVEYEKLSIGEITRKKEFKLNVRYDESRMIKYDGHLAADINGEMINLQDAIVILRDQVRHTDAKGWFSFMFEDSLRADESIFFFCKGFNSVEDSFFSEGMPKQNFVIQPVDSITSYMLMCQAADSISYYYNSMSLVKYKDGGNDTIVFRANQVKSSNKRPSMVAVKGYYYYKSEYNRCPANEHYLSYHLFTGWMGDNWKRNEELGFNIKDIEFEGYDKVHNKQTLIGYRKHSDGEFYGIIKDLGGAIGEFWGVKKKK